MNARKKLNATRTRRANRSSAKITGTAERPRLAVSRTNRFIEAQLIDDATGVTLASASNAKASLKGTKSEQAFLVGEELGKKAAAKGITVAVFDRRSYRFHGRVAQLAEGAKKGGLKI